MTEEAEGALTEGEPRKYVEGRNNDYGGRGKTVVVLESELVGEEDAAAVAQRQQQPPCYCCK